MNMTVRNASAYYRYATSDPFRPIDARVIRGAYLESLSREQTALSLRHLRAGQLASELAVHAAVSVHDSEQWLSKAVSHLSAVQVGSTYNTPRELYLSYVPQFGEVPGFERLKRERLLQCFARGFNRLLANVNDDGLFGQVNEVAAHIAVTSLTAYGITGRLAFIREESNLKRSAEGLRNRDMTLFSDGSSVPVGAYAVQIKTSHPTREVDRYDPRVATIYGEDLHGNASNSVRALVRSVHDMTRDCISTDSQIIFTPTNRVVDTILNTLDKTGPYAA